MKPGDESSEQHPAAAPTRIVDRYQPVVGIHFDQRAWYYVFDYETGETSWSMGPLSQN